MAHQLLAHHQIRIVLLLLQVEEDEGLIYESYRAAHIKGKKHPDPIVETASLASVALPPTTYEHHLPELTVSGKLSDAQLETVVYANMRFRQKIEGGKYKYPASILRNIHNWLVPL